MHSPHLPPAGKGVELTEKDDGFWLRSKIVEPGAIKLVEEGVYGGYSIGIKGPRIVRDISAKNGRIIDGVIVETSLVDYPCLESAKLVDVSHDAVAVKVAPFMLAKAADIDDPAGAAEYIGEAADAELWKKKYSADERRELASQGKALKDGSYPIKDAEDLDNAAILARSGHGDVDGAKRLIARRAKELGVTNPLDDKGDDDKVTTPEVAKDTPDRDHDTAKPFPGAAAPFKKKDDDAVAGRDDADKAALKRLHDLVCPAVETARVLMAHPDLMRNGLAMELGPKALDIVRQLLLHEIEESNKLDSGAIGYGSNAYDVKTLADIYASLYGFVNSEMWQAVNDRLREEMALDALVDLRKSSFLGGDALPPTGITPQDPATAARFDRAYLSTDHAVQGGHATGGDKTPAKKPNAPEAGDFDRGPLGAGEQRPSPANTASASTGNQSGRLYYSNAQRDQMRAALRELHDSLAALDSQICPMPDHGAGKVNTQQDSAPKPVPATTFAAEPDVAKAAPSFDPDAFKATLLEEAQEAFKGALDELRADIRGLRDDVTGINDKVERMAREPDPKEAPYRGPAQTQPAERKSAVNDAIERGRGEEFEREVTLLKGVADTHPEPAVRKFAADKLALLRKQADADLVK